jgi:hypothetical protein
VLHGIDQLIARHTTAVIDDCDPGGIDVKRDIDARAASGNGIVDYVGDGSIERVPNRTKRKQHRRRTRWLDYLAWSTHP